MAVVQDAAHKMHAAEGIGQARDIVYNNSKEQAKMYFGVTLNNRFGSPGGLPGDPQGRVPEVAKFGPRVVQKLIHK